VHRSTRDAGVSARRQGLPRSLRQNAIATPVCHASVIDEYVLWSRARTGAFVAEGKTNRRDKGSGTLVQTDTKCVKRKAQIVRKPVVEAWPYLRAGLLGGALRRTGSESSGRPLPRRRWAVLMINDLRATRKAHLRAAAEGCFSPRAPQVSAADEPYPRASR